jgi:hypothetical protein
MKISAVTRDKLKNVASINPSILFKEGESKLKSIALEKNILASIDVDETFPITCGIYDLNSFLGVFSLFNDPDLEFGEKSVVFTEGTNSCEYFYVDPTIVMTPPDKEINIPSIDVSFELDATAIETLLKASSVLAVDDIIIKGKDGKVVMQTSDVKTPGSNTFTTDLGDYTGEEFVASVKAQYVKVISGNYAIDVSKAGISKWVNEDKGAVYHIAMSIA